MIREWPMIQLRELSADKKWAMNGGPFGSKLVSRDYVEAGVPVIRGGNLSGDSQFSLDNLVFVTEEKADDLLANNAHPGDLVFTQRGTLGQVGLIPDQSGYRRFVISQSQMKLSVNEKKANARFLYYYFRAPSTVSFIQNLGMSSGVPHINLEILRAFLVPVPPLRIQDQIAKLLSRYDDLIESNTRRIAILEEMAQAIYREWFVDLRFPGHEQVEIVESELGPVPTGWRVEPLRELCDLTMGQSPKSEHYNVEGFGLPFHQGVTDFGPRFPTNRIYCTVDNRVAEAGDVLFSVRAPVGRINIAPTKIVLGRGLSSIRSKSGQQEFLFYQLRDVFREEDSMGGGTIFKSVTKADMLGISLVAPSPSVVEDFETTVRPVSAQIANLTQRNAILRKTRDLLLPKLMSGEVEVASMEDELAWATA